MLGTELSVFNHYKWWIFNSRHLNHCAIEADNFIGWFVFWHFFHDTKIICQKQIVLVSWKKCHGKSVMEKVSWKKWTVIVMGYLLRLDGCKLATIVNIMLATHISACRHLCFVFSFFQDNNKKRLTQKKYFINPENNN